MDSSVEATDAQQGRRKLSHIIYRCENENSTGFEHYGGRGISVCEDENSLMDSIDDAMQYDSKILNGTISANDPQVNSEMMALLGKNKYGNDAEKAAMMAELSSLEQVEIFENGSRK